MTPYYQDDAVTIRCAQEVLDLGLLFPLKRNRR